MCLSLPNIWLETVMSGSRATQYFRQANNVNYLFNVVMRPRTRRTLCRSDQRPLWVGVCWLLFKRHVVVGIYWAPVRTSFVIVVGALPNWKSTALFDGSPAPCSPVFRPEITFELSNWMNYLKIFFSKRVRPVICLCHTNLLHSHMVWIELARIPTKVDDIFSGQFSACSHHFVNVWLLRSSASVLSLSNSLPFSTNNALTHTYTHTYSHDLTANLFN